MTDSVVQVAPDSTGKKIANQQILRTDGITTVQRQETVLADPISNLPDALAQVLGGRLATDQRLMDEILLELKRIRMGIGMIAGQDLSAFNF